MNSLVCGCLILEEYVRLPPSLTPSALDSLRPLVPVRLFVGGLWIALNASSLLAARRRDCHHQGCVPAAAVRPVGRLPRGRGDRSPSPRLL